jgi:hypothetical protein
LLRPDTIIDVIKVCFGWIDRSKSPLIDANISFHAGLFDVLERI